MIHPDDPNFDWGQVQTEWHGEMPHPLEPGLKIKEFPIAVKLATQTKFGSHASPQEASAFWKEFQNMNEKLVNQKREPLSPEEYGHVLDHLAPLSFVYHNRPPTMHEVANLRDAKPADVRQHYSDLPDQHHPDITAGNMVRAMKAAEPHAQEHLGRSPVKLEAAYLVHSGAAPAEYYKALSQAQGQDKPQAGQPAQPEGQPQQPIQGGQGGVQAQNR
jgi:hypothetical protein